MRNSVAEGDSAVMPLPHPRHAHRRAGHKVLGQSERQLADVNARGSYAATACTTHAQLGGTEVWLQHGDTPQRWEGELLEKVNERSGVAANLEDGSALMPRELHCDRVHACTKWRGEEVGPIFKATGRLLIQLPFIAEDIIPRALVMCIERLDLGGCNSVVKCARGIAWLLTAHESQHAEERAAGDQSHCAVWTDTMGSHRLLFAPKAAFPAATSTTPLYNPSLTWAFAHGSGAQNVYSDWATPIFARSRQPATGQISPLNTLCAAPHPGEPR